MTWHKHGLVFSPSQGSAWMRSHAQVPTPLLCEDRIRVYFSSRPQPNVSLTSFLDLALDEPTRVIQINADPILELGEPGTFDEHGIMPSCAIRDGERVLLYYSGWSRSVSVPYANSTGLAISEDGGATFRKLSRGPVLAKGIHDPWSATSPAVLKIGDEWHMWYCSGTGWLNVNGKYEHIYDIKHVRSEDGVVWVPGGEIAIAQGRNDEALTRPYVVPAAHGGYEMWYCYRGSRDFRDGEDAYRIGHASSSDLVTWIKDEAAASDGLEPSPEGWDSKMLAYPAAVRSAQRTLLFYNGNGFGRDGFGLASRAEVRS